MRDRILKIMEREGLTPSKFAESIGIQRSAMSHIISGRNNPSLDVLLKILERFTYVDSDWLLFGKGEMIREHVLTEPNLFTNMLENRPNVQVVAENRKEIGVETPVNIQKQPVVEQVICQEKPSKNVSKIMIFYSDNLILSSLKKTRKTKVNCSVYTLYSCIFADKLSNRVYEEVHLRHEGD